MSCLVIGIQQLVEFVLSNVLVDFWKSYTDNLFFKIPSIRWDTDSSWNIDLGKIHRNWILETNLGRLVLVDCNISTALCEIGCDKISHNEIRKDGQFECFANPVLQL